MAGFQGRGCRDFRATRHFAVCLPHFLEITVCTEHGKDGISAGYELWVSFSNYIDGLFRNTQ